MGHASRTLGLASRTSRRTTTAAPPNLAMNKNGLALIMVTGCKYHGFNRSSVLIMSHRDFLIISNVAAVRVG